VAAYIAAKRDDRSLAIYDAAQATRFAPDDPFVMRTAGQVVAWYDARDKGAADESTRSSVETIRQRLAGHQGYAEAYGNAAAAYKKLGQGGSPSPATTEPSPAAVQTESAPAPTTYPGPVYEPETPIYNNSYAYYYPSYPAGPSYPYWWPNYGFGAFWWWPSFSSVVIIDDDFHHHHHDFDSFHDHHHDFDDPHFFHHDGDFSRHEHDGFADSRFHGHDGDFFGNGRHDFGGAGFVGHHDDMHAMTAAGHLDPAPARSPSAWQTMGAATGSAAQPRQIDAASVHGGLPWGAMNQAQRAPQRIEGGSFHGTSSWGGRGMATPPMVTRSAPAAPGFAATSMHASAPMPAMPAAGAMPAGAGMGGMHGGGRGGGGHR
jgi:hypothetical protein